MGGDCILAPFHPEAWSIGNVQQIISDDVRLMKDAVPNPATRARGRLGHPYDLRRNLRIKMRPHRFCEVETLVEVDHKVDFVADGLSHGGNSCDIVGESIATKPQQRNWRA